MKKNKRERKQVAKEDNKDKDVKMAVDDDHVDLNKVQVDEPEVKDNGPPSASLFCQDHYLKLVFND